jgi:hypothetical protein
MSNSTTGGAAAAGAAWATAGERWAHTAIALARAGAHTLNLDDVSLGDAGATRLASMLPGNDTVTTMYLGSNQIGDEGARALADALRQNATVTKM